MADYDRFAIHTLVSQTADGALTLGDSHEYGLAIDIFNKSEIDELVMRNVREFLMAPDCRSLSDGTACTPSIRKNHGSRSTLRPACAS